MKTARLNRITRTPLVKSVTKQNMKQYPYEEISFRKVTKCGAAIMSY